VTLLGSSTQQAFPYWIGQSTLLILKAINAEVVELADTPSASILSALYSLSLQNQSLCSSKRLLCGCVKRPEQSGTAPLCRHRVQKRVHLVRLGGDQQTASNQTQRNRTSSKRTSGPLSVNVRPSMTSVSPGIRSRVHSSRKEPTQSHNPTNGFSSVNCQP
jgi:hypothetical protein